MNIMIFANNDVGLYKFRKEFVEELLKQHEVFICLPKGIFVKQLIDLGSTYIPCELLNRHGINPLKELKLIKYYKSILKKYNPDIVLTYTVKPNIYGGIVCKQCKIPYIANITGLGIAIENGGILQKLLVILYKIGLKNAKHVFFQNTKNQEFMISKGIVKENNSLLPGSGVNLKENKEEIYPKDDGVCKFLFVGRIMKDKGIEEYLECAKDIKKRFENVQFSIVGSYDDFRYETVIDEFQNSNIVTYYGEQMDVHSFMKTHNAIIHPSYHEGLSNVLLEAAACGRPILASNISGCRETFDEGISGFGFEVRNSKALIEVVEKFISISYEEKKNMGRKGREKIEKEFDRNIVVEAYLKQISRIL